MTKITQNLLIILKITDFLLGLEFHSKSLFCRYWCVTYVCQFSCMYMKHSWKAVDFLGIGGAVEPFCHTLFWILYQTKIFTRFDACAKFHDFLSMFRPSKMRFILEKYNNNKYSCKQRWRAQATNAIATPVASGKLCPAGTCIHNIPLAVRF